LVTELTDEDLETKITTLESKIDALLEKTKKQAEAPPQPEPQQAPQPEPQQAPQPEPQQAPQPEPQQAPQPEPQPQTMYSEGGKSRNEQLQDYEKEYLERLAEQIKEEVELQRAAEELVAKRKGESQTVQVSSNRGSMPKGWNS